MDLIWSKPDPILFWYHEYQLSDNVWCSGVYAFVCTLLNWQDRIDNQFPKEKEKPKKRKRKPLERRAVMSQGFCCFIWCQKVNKDGIKKNSKTRRAWPWLSMQRANLLPALALLYFLLFELMAGPMLWSNIQGVSNHAGKTGHWNA